MKSVNKTQIVVIAGSLLIIVLLLFANTKLPKKQEAAGSEHAGHTEVTLSASVDNVKKALSAAQKLSVEKLEGAIKTSADKKTAYENMINFWDSIQKPLVAAYYMEQAATASPVESNWLESGNRYYAATRFATTEEERHMLFGEAMESFEKVLAINPKNTEAKINLGSCYVEGSSDPMKGIGMLKEVEKTDSNNINLQLNFAFFSERSGQWDKAIARFEKVLKIQPDFIEAHLHLADAYEQKGDKANAIKSLQTYMDLVDDVTIKTEIQDYINKLSQ